MPAPTGLPKEFPLKPHLQISQLGEFMSRHVADVFSTLLYLPASLSTKPTSPLLPMQVSSCVGLAGENIAGMVYVHFSETFTRCATAAMLGLGPNDPLNQPQINQAVSEVANMLVGGLKAWLGTHGHPCAMTTPTLIRGRQFSFEPFPDLEQTTLVFDCAGDQVRVEIRARLN